MRGEDRAIGNQRIAISARIPQPMELNKRTTVGNGIICRQIVPLPHKHVYKKGAPFEVGFDHSA
jgi:hypothetical protein